MDGFGSRSVIVLETLERLMETTGQSVTDMFDIICGSSFGALIALGLVYGKYVCTYMYYRLICTCTVLL